MTLRPESLGPGAVTLQRLASAAFIVSIPLGTLTASIDLVVAGKPVSGYTWVIQILLGITAFVVCRRNRPFVQPFLLWIPWILWVIVRCDCRDPWAFQRTIMMLAPLLLGTVAANLLDARQEVRYLLGWIPFITVTLFLLGLVQRLGGSLPLGMRFRVEGSGMTLFLAAAYFSIQIYAGRRHAILLYLMCVATCAIFALRGDTFACLLAPLLCPIRGTRVQKWHLLLLIMVLGVSAVLAGPMREKMSVGGVVAGRGLEDKLKALNTSGRAYAWGLYWQEVKNNPVWGHGGGSSGTFGKLNIMDETQWHHPHNEYIRVLFEYGLVGLAFLSLPLVHMIHTALRLAKVRGGLLTDAWLVVHVGLILGCLVAITDNVLLNIQFYGNFLFTLAGAAWALSADVSGPVFAGSVPAIGIHKTCWGGETSRVPGSERPVVYAKTMRYPDRSRHHG